MDKDDAEALRWIRKAAEQGLADAQACLGYIFFCGDGLRPDSAEAVKWYRKSAEQGNVFGQYALGWHYCEGIGVAADPVEEAKWYRKAAEQGHAKSQYQLAYMYDVGRGVPRDDAEALKWLRRAAEQGSASAKHTLRVIAEESSPARSQLPGAPCFLTAAQPKDYTQKELEDELERRLTPDEFLLVKNPLTCTPAMTNWAQQITAGAKNDLQKAEMLFQTLTAHPMNGPGGKRVASEVFADWQDSRGSFRCMEYAYLNTALARAVGLKAYWASVEESCVGRKVPHACAAIFISGKVILSDTTFGFGAPHKKFTVLNDVQVVGTYATGLDPSVAAELAPEIMLVRLNLLSSGPTGASGA